MSDLLVASKKDPDADPDEAAAEFDSRRAQTGTAGTTGTAGATGATETSGGDQSVEHYEHTSEPGVERERRFERDADGNIIRDDELEQPRRNT